MFSSDSNSISALKLGQNELLLTTAQKVVQSID